MRTRVVAILPVLVVAGLYARVTESVVLAVLTLVALVVSLALAPYLEAPPFVQRGALVLVAVFGGFGGAAALTGLEPEGRTRPTELLGRIAVTALLLAVTRRFFREPEGGVRFDFALLTVAVVACGQKHIGGAYTVAVVLFAVAIVAVIRARDSTVGWSVVEANAVRATAGVVLVVAVLSTLGMSALPWLARVTQRQFDIYVMPAQPARIGFTDTISTVQVDSLTASEEIVFRIYGPRVDYLRGRVYDQFDGGEWVDSKHLAPARVETLARGKVSTDVTEVRAVGSLEKADSSAHFFAPLGAHHVRTAHGEARVDRFGAYRPVDEEAPTPLWFERGAPDQPVEPPSDVDLAVPPHLMEVVHRLAISWTGGATTPRAKLEALEHHLRSEFTYTLAAIPHSRDYALVNFLLHTRSGHCELFATAMVLMARSIGVPARIVGGFRVSEHNSFGHYDVVRSKNAHAWVEGWVDDGWRTFDPTPPTEANRPSDRRTLQALGDVARALWDRALELLGRASLWQFGVLLALAVGSLTAVRLLRARRERRALEAGLDDADASLPCFRELEKALAGHGQARPHFESLERYADRLRRAELDRAADAVAAYGALRYGGVGDPASVARRVLECAEDIARRTGPP